MVWCVDDSPGKTRQVYIQKQVPRSTCSGLKAFERRTWFFRLAMDTCVWSSGKTRDSRVCDVPIYLHRKATMPTDDSLRARSEFSPARRKGYIVRKVDLGKEGSTVRRATQPNFHLFLRLNHVGGRPWTIKPRTLATDDSLRMCVMKLVLLLCLRIHPP